MNKKLIFAGAMAVGLLLAACNGNNNDPKSSKQASSSGTPVVGNLANGTFDLSTKSWQEKSKIVAALETYAMENHSAGIPIYDDASYQQFSSRLQLPSTKYLTNYGFGVGYGRINGEAMYDGDIVESESNWRSYFHGYTNTDSGTFNGWDATGADVSDRMSMIASSYFGVKANDDNTAYDWVGSLSKYAEPIMLDSFQGNPTDLSGLTDEEKESKTSQFWRVILHTGAGYTYRYVGKEAWKAKYDGRQVVIDDYLTPFREMLNHKLTRAAELVSDSGGLQGAMAYYYNSDLQQKAANDWTKSGVGVQIYRNAETGEEGLDFAFIQPKSMVYARTNLSSQLYSPVPSEFIQDVGYQKYGMIGSGEGVFDNILCFGAYVPEYWQQGIRIVFQRNADYYEASDFHFNGYVEDIFSGNDSDEQAYRAFLENKLDEVTIPTAYVEGHKNDPNVLRTEGSTIIKLNLNTCTEEEWLYYFGDKGTTYTHERSKYWDVKPIMSNEDFINGMYFSLNRKLYADKAGRNPAMGYLSNAYMLDPAGKVSYRASADGQGVLSRYHQAAGGEANWGHSDAYAQTLFKNAIKQLIASGDYTYDDTIVIKGIYRYQTTIDNIGRPVADDIENNFNTAARSLGYNELKLQIDLEVGGSSYTDTYTRMDHGEFDYAEGAISGNVLNPLEFMNTLSTTKSLHQGFNLNWGHRTDIISPYHPAHYEYVEDGVTKGGNWSYDALYNAAQGFTPVTDGCDTPIASNETIYESGNNVVWRAEFPDNATDEEGNSLFRFKIDGFAILTSASGTPDNGNYYSSARLSQDDNGYIRITVPKEGIKQVAGSVESSSGLKQKVFSFMFTLIYSIELESGTIEKAININTAPQKIEDFNIGY